MEYFGWSEGSHGTLREAPALLQGEMPSREFPAPPDLSELLKFFESAEGKARVVQQNGQKGVPRATAPRSREQSSQSDFSKPLTSKSPRTSTSKTWKPADKPVAAGGRRLSQSISATHKSIREEKITTTQDWNGSTQLPPAPANILRHQLLSRTYQHPTPVFMVPSEATRLLDRLAKGTISSRSKLKSQGDKHNGEEKSLNGVRPASQADTRGRDAIQTLLFYRKEVEKRRRVDSSNSLVDE